MQGAKNMNILLKENDFLNTGDVIYSIGFNFITFTRESQEPEEYKWL